MFTSKFHALLSIVLPAVLILICSTFIIGSPRDEEEFRFAILSAWLQIDALFDGRPPFWTSRLGLGVPLPLVPNFVLHPLSPLLAVVSPATWARLLLALHTIVGTIGMWRLLRYLGASRPTTGLAVATFLLATPTQNYILRDFWPSHYIAWTMAPWLLLLAWRILDAPAREGATLSLVAGLCGGLVVATTNPGHIVVYAVVVGGVVVCRIRDVLARAHWFVLAGFVALVIGAPGLVQLLHERPLFDPTLAQDALPRPLPASAIWKALLSPTIALDEPRTRTLFFGGPFTVLALIGCVRFWKRYPELVAIIAVSSVLLFTDATLLPFVSARYQFRDPLTLAAIPLAALMLDVLMTTARVRVAHVMAAAQVLVLLFTAWPILSRTWSPDALRGLWLRGGSGVGDVADVLARVIPSEARIAFGPMLDDAIYEGGIEVDGLVSNALAYRGLTVLNGWFKGASTDNVSPDPRLPYGRISIPPQMTQSSAGLDVLGVRYLLADPDEPVAGDLRPLKEIASARGRLVLYENTDPWPLAFVLDAGAEHISLTALPGCRHTRTVCLDLGLLTGQRRADGLATTHDDGHVTVRLLAADTPRLLVISQMFRPDWQAASPNGALMTRPVVGGMIGLTVPPGVTSIELRYRPTMVIVAHAVAAATIIICTGMLVVLVRARAARTSATAASDIPQPSRLPE